MKRIKYEYKRNRLLALLLVMVLSFSACNQSDNKKEDSKKTSQEENLSFDEFLDQMLTEDLTSDLTVYVQFVENPDNFGITTNKNSLNGIGLESFNQQTKEYEERLAQLQVYDYNELTKAQKLDYDTIKAFLEERISIKDCAYYQDNLSTTQGDHVILPGIISLHADRFFDTLEVREIQDVSAVSEYFEIYEALGNYLKEIAQFERDKAEQGLFMTADRANQVAEVCEQKVSDECLEIQETFEAELSELTWLSEPEKETLLEENTKLVKEHLVTGYQSLVDAMKDCSDKGGKVSYISETDAGRRYYEYVVQSSMDENSSVDEMAALLDSYVKEWLAEKEEILKDNPTIVPTINKKLKAYTDSDLLIKTLTEKSKEYFPNVSMEWGTEAMPECMNSFAGGLFYAQPLDSSIPKQAIYAGTMLTAGTPNYVQVIGHEGVPGHLYNYTYFLGLDDVSQYRKLAGWINSLGTIEGWTTYIEEYCYRFVGLNEQEARYLELLRLIELGLVQTIDFGVNYSGWEKVEVTNYLKEYEPAYLLATDYIDEMVRDSFCTLGPYVLGYIYLTQIKEQMKEQMGSSFTDLDFHTAYLNVGPTTFDLLREQLLENK